MKITVVAAMAKNRTIGDNGSIPWAGKFPEDMKHFRNLTEGPGKAVLMGRKTWESIGSKPLRNRTNIVLTRDTTYPLDPYVVRVQSQAEALVWCQYNAIENLFVIGGAQVYREAVRYADELILTEIEKSYGGDAKFPFFDTNALRCWGVESGTNAEFSYQFQFYRRRHLMDLNKESWEMPSRAA
jgi:dihydrofolate reductase